LASAADPLQYHLMVIDLSGRAVLFTGASRGIGAAIARRLAAAGARVAVHYGHNRAAAEKLANEIGQGAQVFGQDLADAAGCETLWNAVQEHFGTVDALINNAGIAVPSPLDTSTTQWLKHWNETMAVNLTAAGVLSRAAIAHFRAHGGGRIVNVASRAAFRGDQPDYLAYAASKAGMVALTRSIARAFGKDGITAFALAPGFTRTEMAQEFIDKYGPDFAMKDIALARLTEPDDIAPMAVFLVSGLADHATGTTIDLNAASYVR
jgi:NAD(P)-dependent dehydrogenase (short-subunit alcohol dehydrogenase family)